MATLTAPEIQRYCEMLSHRLSASFHSTAVFDARTYQILDKIFDQIKQVMPRERDYRRLGSMAPGSSGLYRAVRRLSGMAGGRRDLQLQGIPGNLAVLLS